MKAAQEELLAKGQARTSLRAGRAQRTLSSQWMAYTITFAELAQAGWGVAAPTANIDTSTLMELNIVVPQGQDFDYWLDDITFSL